MTTSTIIALQAILLLSPQVSERHAHAAIAAVAIIALSRDGREAADLSRRAWAESRWRPGATATDRRGRQACGLWQIQPRWHGVSCSDLQTHPVLSARLALRVYRAMRHRCGEAWRVCWTHGPSHPAARRAVAAARRRR